MFASNIKIRQGDATRRYRRQADGDRSCFNNNRVANMLYAIMESLERCSSVLPFGKTPRNLRQ